MLRIILVLILVGCSSESDYSPEPILPEPTVTPNVRILPTKVIDGYISGANIFIDFNWNLIQDDGEPSAYEDTENQIYYFEDDQFDAIEDISIECAQSRPRVAEIPEGAEDSERGTITEAYELYYFPYFAGTGEQGEYRANVTPLTSLFTSYISEYLGGSSIPVSEGCGSNSNDIGTKVVAKVEEVLNQLSNRFNIDAYTFYDDFIESGDEELQAYAELIVDFLKTTNKVTFLLEQEYEINMRTQIDIGLIETILSKEDFETVTFALFSETFPVTHSDSYYSYDLYAFYDVVASSSGELLDSSGNPYEITIDNLKSNTDFTIRSITTINDAVFNNLRVLFETGENNRDGKYNIIEFGTFYGDESDFRTMIHAGEFRKSIFKDRQYPLVGETRIAIGYELQIRNNENPYFDFEFDRIIDTRDPGELEDIYNEFQALSNTMGDITNNHYLIYNNDYQELSNSEWTYYERQDEELYQSCRNRETEEIITGTEAYLLCSENID